MSSPAAAAFVRTRVAPAAEAWEARGEMPIGLATDLAAAAAARMGAGDDGFAARRALAEELGAVDSLGAAAALLHVSGALRGLLPLLSPLARERLRIGETCGALAFTTAEGSAVVSRPGASLRVDGFVPAVLGVPGAHWLAVPARRETADHGPVLVLLPASAPGAAITRIETVGLRAAPLGEVRLDGCAVEPWQVVAGPVPRLLESALADERLLLAALASAAAGRCLRRTLAFAGTRPFAPGQVLGELAVVRHRLADLTAAHEIAAALEREAASERLAGAVAPSRAASVAWVCVDALRRVAEGCMQLLGARGFMDDHPVSRAYRDAVTLPLLPALDTDSLLREMGDALFGPAAAGHPAAENGSRATGSTRSAPPRKAVHPLPLATAALALAEAEPVPCPGAAVRVVPSTLVEIREALVGAASGREP
jgi:alkylation response protein AidB-like acyl-CoA dehydrogenase